jgi:protease-4
MVNFLKYMLATIVGIIVTLTLFFFIMLGIIASQTEKEAVVVKEQTILKLDLTKVIQERQPKNPLADFMGEDDAVVSGLDAIKMALAQAKEDDKVEGIYIDAGIILGGGLATIEEVRNALIDFKSSEKFIIAYGENYSQKAYYLASVADKVFLNPMGIVDFKGFNGQVMFFKNALEKLDVEVQIIRGPNNKFKAAVEPFMYDKMSEANREQTKQLLGSIWNDMLENISESRNVPEKDLQLSADRLDAYHANSAKDAGIIDDVKYWDEVQAELREMIDLKKTDKINYLALSKYAQTVKPKNRKQKEKIAVIYAVGEIQSGEGNDETIGSDRIAKAIRKATADSTVKAIVLRVNSPGGSAQASEVMYRELQIAQKVKPLVVSMGDYAASGGYYIACLADKIYAQPNTITGSIGVFGMVPNAQKLINERIGITFDGVKTGENADIYSLTQALSPYQTEVIRNMINNIYSTFIEHVAAGRNMTTAEVDSIGQGRVWSGMDAKEIGLVDELGGLDDAIAYAAEQANLEQYRIKAYPKLVDPLEEFIKQLNNDASLESLISNKMGVYGQYLNYWTKMENIDPVQARLPYFIEIE